MTETLLPFQRYVDQHQASGPLPYLLPTRMQDHVCWLRDGQGRQRVAVCRTDWDQLPNDACATAVRYQGQVRLLGICDGRVVAVIPVIGASGIVDMPRI